MLMKRLVLLFLLVPFFALAKGPQIKFLQTLHDFGNIKENGGKVYADFQFVNVGDSPLVILRAQSSCGCTKANYPVEPVEPGDTAIVKVSYDPKGNAGEFNKIISVKSNSVKNGLLKIRINGCVLPKNR